MKAGSHLNFLSTYYSRYEKKIPGKSLKIAFFVIKFRICNSLIFCFWVKSVSTLRGPNTHITINPALWASLYTRVPDGELPPLRPGGRVAQRSATCTNALSGMHLESSQNISLLPLRQASTTNLSVGGICSTRHCTQDGSAFSSTIT